MTPLLVGVGCLNVVYNPSALVKRKEEDIDMLAIAGSNTNEPTKD